MKRILFVLMLFPLWASAQGLAVGAWRDHFPYGSLIAVTEADDKIYAASTFGLFSVEKEGLEVERINKIQGLAGTGLSAIAYSSANKVLVVGYQDGNIDLVLPYFVKNIPFIKNKDMQGGKGINHIFINGDKAYLACDFGIVLMDLKKQELQETYFIGPDNSSVKVFDICMFDSLFYAGTDAGLYHAPVKGVNLSNSANWKRDTLLGLTSSFSNVQALSGRIVCARDEDNGKMLFQRQKGTSWQLWKTVDINELKASSGRFLLTSSGTDYQGYVEVYTEDLQLDYRCKFTDPSQAWLQKPHASIIDKSGDLWITDNEQGLVRVRELGTQAKWISPDGPRSSTVFSLSQKGSELYMSAGSYNQTYTPAFRSFIVSFFDGKNWGWNYLAGYHDAVAVIEDPHKPGHYYGCSWAEGLLEFDNHTLINHYDTTNSTLRNAFTQTGSGTIRVGGGAIDNAGNVWLPNSMAPKALSVKRTDGSWNSYDLSPYFTGNLQTLICDYYNQLWMIVQNQQLFVSRESNGSMETVQMNLNLGNDEQTYKVNCIIEDDLGYLWVGTDKGIKINMTSLQIFDNPNGNVSSSEFEVIYVDGFPLLYTEEITAIATDGGDRKWIGTASSGVFLVSSDGYQQIHHFTTDNSPLVSNSIISLAVSPLTGEVFIGTDNGLMGYGGDATQGTSTNKKAFVYPNPVKPDYNGEISIRGLTQNAHVRITDAAGNLVYQTTANGGTATWNGRLGSGNRAASGVYLVFATNDDGSIVGVSKIYFLH